MDIILSQKSPILVVDDDSANIFVVTSLLHDLNQRSDRALSGSAAIEMIKTRIR